MYHYKPKSYRLNEETINNLAEIAEAEGISYNMLFVRFIRIYKNKKKKYEY